MKNLEQQNLYLRDKNLRLTNKNVQLNLANDNLLQRIVELQTIIKTLEK